MVVYGFVGGGRAIFNAIQKFLAIRISSGGRTNFHPENQDSGHQIRRINTYISNFLN